MIKIRTANSEEQKFRKEKKIRREKLFFSPFCERRTANSEQGTVDPGKNQIIFFLFAKQQTENSECELVKNEKKILFGRKKIEISFLKKKYFLLFSPWSKFAVRCLPFTFSQIGKKPEI